MIGDVAVARHRGVARRERPHRARAGLLPHRADDPGRSGSPTTSLPRSPTSRRHGHRFSALLLDSIFSSDGIYLDPSILAPAAAIVHRAGGVFIADEVQPGFGRTGEAMWGFKRHGVMPDLVTIGKPMGNGLPVAAMAARPRGPRRLRHERCRTSTPSAEIPVSMAAAAAVLDVIQDDEAGRPRRRGRYRTTSQLSDARRAVPVHRRRPRSRTVRRGRVVTDPETKAHDRAQAQRSSTRCGRTTC